MLEPFEEVITLLRFIITIPMITVEAGRDLSTLKRIKILLKSTMDEERLSTLAMMSTEKEMIHKLFDFNERVIDRFANRKER